MDNGPDGTNKTTPDQTSMTEDKEPTEMTTPAPAKPKPKKVSKAKASQRARRLTPADLTVEDLKMALWPSEHVMFDSLVQRALHDKKERIKEEAKR
jgi:hypothetical protein